MESSLKKLAEFGQVTISRVHIRGSWVAWTVVLVDKLGRVYVDSSNTIDRACAKVLRKI